MNYLMHITRVNLKIIMLRQATQKQYTLYDYIYRSSRKGKLTYSDRKQISHCLGIRGRG